jgi:hypothetical protein
VTVPCREGLGHRTTPGKIARTRVATLPDGTLAEVVTDDDMDAWARLRDPSGTWHHVAHRAEDIDVTAAPDGNGALVVVVAFVPDDYMHTTAGRTAEWSPAAGSPRSLQVPQPASSTARWKAQSAPATAQS